MNKTVTLAMAFAIVVLIVVIYATMGTARFRCEVCMSFQGHSACRIASAPAEADALRSATEAACAQIAYGMNSMGGNPTGLACVENTPPVRVKWLSRK